MWNMDRWEDPIWRNDRIGALNLHFITAFLGLHLRGEVAPMAYLNVPVENSDDRCGRRRMARRGGRIARAETA
jgi:hypothetical protein